MIPDESLTKWASATGQLIVFCCAFLFQLRYVSTPTDAVARVIKTWEAVEAAAREGKLGKP